MLPLQNGVEAPGQIAEALGRAHALGGTAKIIAFRVGPGHVVHAGALEHRTGRTARDHTGTGRGRTQHDDAGRLLTLHGVRDGALDARHGEERLLGLLDTLGDRRGHLLGLAVADADHAVAVTDDHQGGEAEATTTLDDLGDAVDLDHALLEIEAPGAHRLHICHVHALHKRSPTVAG